MSGSDSDFGKEHTTPDAADRFTNSVRKISTFESLRIRNFRVLLTGTTLSNAAQWIQQVTLNWLVYDLTGSGIILGSINLVRSVAALGIVPVAGILIDHLQRRRLLIIENGWLFTITLALGLMIIFGHSNIAYLFIFTFLAGMVQTVDQSLRQVLVFDLVPRSHTPNGMALVQTGWGLMRSFGPAIGGFLILWFGPGGNFLVQAAVYALIIITIIQIQFPTRKSSILHDSSTLDNIKEGFRYLMKERVTRTFMMLGLALPLFIIPIFVILPPIYAVEIFGDESGRVLGFLMASVGVGGIAGGIVTASLGHLERRGLLQLASLFLLSMSLIGFAFSTILLVSLLFLALSGFFEIIFLTTSQTLIQLSILDSLRGRVTTVVNLNMALAPMAGLVAGVGADLLGGPRTITIILAGIAAAIAVVFFICSPTVRNYRLSQAVTPDSDTPTTGLRHQKPY
ncbi:MAG: MFS transporter [Dehalococcoidia bacterium]